MPRKHVILRREIASPGKWSESTYAPSFVVCTSDRSCDTEAVLCRVMGVESEMGDPIV